MLYRYYFISPEAVCHHFRPKKKRQKHINISELVFYDKCESLRSLDLHEGSAEAGVVIEVRDVVIGVGLCGETHTQLVPRRHINHSV